MINQTSSRVSLPQIIPFSNDDALRSRPSGFRALWNWVRYPASWLISMVAHGVLLIALVLIQAKGAAVDTLPLLSQQPPEPIEEIEEVEPIRFDVSNVEDMPVNEPVLDTPEEITNYNPNTDNPRRRRRILHPRKPLTIARSKPPPIHSST